MPFTQRDPQLSPSKVRTEAPMDPAAEREVPVDLSIEPDLERLGELGGIEVRGAEVDHDEMTGVDLLPTDDVVLAGPADRLRAPASPTAAAPPPPRG